MTEEEIQIRVRNRLGLPASQGPRILTLISASLDKLARNVANDPTKRFLLLTDKASVTASITNSNSEYYADLSTVISTNGVMPDYLEYGTIYYQPPALAFTANATTDRCATAATNGYWDGLKVQVSNSGGALPSGLATATDFYLGGVNASKLNFVMSVSRAAAFAETALDLVDAGTGTHTVTPWEFKTVQFNTREFGTEAQPLPTTQIRGWLVGTKLYTNALAGTFSFTVPYVPTLSTLSSKLDHDLIDTVADLYNLSSEISDESK